MLYRPVLTLASRDSVLRGGVPGWWLRRCWRWQCTITTRGSSCHTRGGRGRAGSRRGEGSPTTHLVHPRTTLCLVCGRPIAVSAVGPFLYVLSQGGWCLPLCGGAGRLGGGEWCGGGRCGGGQEQRASHGADRIRCPVTVPSLPDLASFICPALPGTPGTALVFPALPGFAGASLLGLQAKPFWRRRWPSLWACPLPWPTPPHSLR